MRKLVIANRGAGEIGKSASIRQVYYLLKDARFAVLDEKWQWVEGIGDIRAIFDVNGVKVGIESLGDPGGEMEASMEFFVNHGCEIIVTACRTKSDTYHCVTDYLARDNAFEVLWCAHNVYQIPFADETRDMFNRLYAQHVLWLIDSRVKGVI